MGPGGYCRSRSLVSRPVNEEMGENSKEPAKLGKLTRTACSSARRDILCVVRCDKEERGGTTGEREEQTQESTAGKTTNHQWIRSGNHGPMAPKKKRGAQEEPAPPHSLTPTDTGASNSAHGL